MRVLPKFVAFDFNIPIILKLSRGCKHAGGRFSKKRKAAELTPPG